MTIEQLTTSEGRRIAFSDVSNHSGISFAERYIDRMQYIRSFSVGGQSWNWISPVALLCPAALVLLTLTTLSFFSSSPSLGSSSSDRCWRDVHCVHGQFMVIYVLLFALVDRCAHPKEMRLTISKPLGRCGAYFYYFNKCWNFVDWLTTKK